MPMWLRILVSLLLLAALTAAPWLWRQSPLLVIVVLLPAVTVWSIWLIVSYLRWARGLSRAKSMHPPRT